MARKATVKLRIWRPK